jgi:DNA invertase Pin-like site-specific DNA recombinase
MDTRKRPLVAYIRVSTERQGQSKLGLDAQQAQVRAYAEIHRAQVIASFTEVETGKKSDRERPELARALGHARRTGSILVVAKLDRLARNARFLLALIEGGVDVVFCDLPNVTPDTNGKLILTFMAGIAEWEANRISDRTREALASYKADGRISKRLRDKYPPEQYPGGVPPEVVARYAGKLGSHHPDCKPLSKEIRDMGRLEAAARQAERARLDYADLEPEIRRLRAAGESLRQIAAKLNIDGHPTRGRSKWTSTQVHRVLRRMGPAR